MQKEIKLSIVIITFNEEKNIRRCLASVQSIADDIVVVDSYSTDATAKICESMGARFVQHAFEGHIQQKNYAITQAKYPYVLSLDADEALDERLISEIKKVKLNWEFDGYSMNRLTNYCGHWVRHCGWYPDVKLRLWDSRLGSWGGINPHDEYFMQKTAKTSHLQGDILHYSYNSIADHYKQVEYFTSISAKAYFEKGIKSNQMKIWINPIHKFLRDYFFKLGILDGKAGFSISRISAYATYLKYKKLLDLHKAN
jgi:glycosyltransferase involved in cell wall biosynthesis